MVLDIQIMPPKISKYPVNQDTKQVLATVVIEMTGDASQSA